MSTCLSHLIKFFGIEKLNRYIFYKLSVSPVLFPKLSSLSCILSFAQKYYKQRQDHECNDRCTSNNEISWILTSSTSADKFALALCCRACSHLATKHSPRLQYERSQVQFNGNSDPGRVVVIPSRRGNADSFLRQPGRRDDIETGNLKQCRNGTNNERLEIGASFPSYSKRNLTSCTSMTTVYIINWQKR